MKLKDKKCAACDDRFTPTSGRQKYCSDICKEEFVRVHRNKRAAKFYKKHREEILEKNKNLSDERKEYLKEYFKSEAGKAVRRRYYLKNKEYFHQKTRERRAKEKEKKNNSDK